MNLIKNTFGVDIGHLYTVEQIMIDENVVFQLNDIGEDEEEGLIQIELQHDDPIVKRFADVKLPLTQYDLDYLPIYRKSSLSDSPKFLSQAMDVYVPIHQNERWIGLIALGAKTSGDRETLADQSAVALENAKLFRRLQQMNKELTNTKEELEEVNARLLEVDQLKSAFISVITHEMRTPLSNLAFSLQIFDMYGRENLTGEQQNQLEELHSGLVSAQRMIDNLVTFAAFLNNQIELKPVEFDIRDVVSSAMKPNLAAAEEKDINLELDVSGMDFLVHGDQKLLTDAVFHLINNAVKYTQDGGKITIFCWTTEDDYSIYVKDTGIGISQERMNSIWDAFVSISNPLHRGWEGLGLGLALVKLIVQSHGGHVWADSESGKGSEFGFKIPLVDQKEKKSPSREMQFK
jgi:signal transduction histidine kinase